MTVSSVIGTTAGSTATTTPKNQLQGTQDEFLKMFMAQLQNQDPMNPQQGADMVAQLAQFTQVEQTTKTNTQLSALTAQETSSASAGMANLVGRTADATAGDFSIGSTGGTPPPLAITSTGAMSGATAQVTDASGKVIRTLPIPNGTASVVQWDGKDDSGKPVAPGSYHLTINAGKSPNAITAQWHGTIDSVELTDGGARLRMGDILLTPADIRSIGTSTPSATTTTAISQAAAIAALSTGASS